MRTDSGSVLLSVHDVSKTFARSGVPAVALDRVSFELHSGETLGLIGESGSGKSTLGRIVLGLMPADAGTVRFGDVEIGSVSPRALRKLRRRVQVVFQEPAGQLNPRLRVGSIIGEMLAIHERGLSRVERRDRVIESMEQVGLSAQLFDRHPGSLSGGQQQRVGIARALITRPEFVLLDEPTSSLDLSVRAQILDLLGELRERLGLSYLFISHDLATVGYFCDRIMVMRQGRIVESGDAEAVLSNPTDEHTRQLLASTLSTRPPLEGGSTNDCATSGATTQEEKEINA